MLTYGGPATAPGPRNAEEVAGMFFPEKKPEPPVVIEDLAAALALASGWSEVGNMDFRKVRAAVQNLVDRLHALEAHHKENVT